MKIRIIKTFIMMLIFINLMNVSMAETPDNKYERIILTTNETTEEDIKTGYILVGDSRFVGMKYVFNINDYENCYIVCKSSMGLNWLKKDAIKQINEIIDNNSDIEHWIILSNLGVNDINNAKNYLEFYDSIDSDTIDIILMSVNPAGSEYVKMNAKIEAFNEIIKASNYEYIDSYSAMKKDGYNTYDGIHYTKDTYKYIFNIICENLWETSETTEN